MGWLARRRERKKYLALFRILAKLLRIQTVLIRHRVSFEEVGGAKNDGAIGYVYGFADAALHVANLELDNENGSFLLTYLYEGLSNGRGERLFEYIVWHTELPEISAAIRHGGEDYLNWVKRKGQIPPMGLGRYFGKGEAGS